jgi:hypothetical protein
MNPSAVLDWLVKLGIPGILIALVSLFLGHRLSARREARREHLSALKSRVLSPIQKELEEFYLPLLRGKIAPVMSQHVTIPLGGSVTQAALTREWRLAPRTRYGEYPVPYLTSSKPVPMADPMLYKDAKEHHYQRFIRRLEEFKAEVTAYTGKWLPYAESLRDKIAARTPLPEARGEISSISGPWVDSKGLAVFVLERLIGVHQELLFLRSETGSSSLEALSRGVIFARAQQKEPLQRLVELLDDLCRDRETAEVLRRRGEPLREPAEELLDEATRLNLSSGLPGRCPLARP